MHGPRWGSPEDELRREYRALIERAHGLAHENYVLRWLLAEARQGAITPSGIAAEVLVSAI